VRQQQLVSTAALNFPQQGTIILAAVSNQTEHRLLIKSTIDAKAAIFSTAVV